MGRCLPALGHQTLITSRWFLPGAPQSPGGPFLPRRRVIDHHHAVGPGRGEALAVRAEGHRVNVARAADGHEFLARCRLPDPYTGSPRPIQADCRSDPLPVGGEHNTMAAIAAAAAED